MSDNWIRAYRLTVMSMGGSFEIGDGDPHVLKIKFSVELGKTENCNTTKISVWNLNDEHIKILENNVCKIRLKVGYGKDGNNVQQIFVGDVNSAHTTKDNGNVVTEIEASDGYKNLKDADFDLCYKSSIDSQTVYRRIASEMGCAIEFADDLSFKVFPQHYFYVGKPKGALDKVAEYNGHTWSIQNEIVQVTNPNKPLKMTAYLISPETGLISIPKSETEDEGDKQKAGWEMISFMNPGIQVNSIVQVQSRYLTGTFVVDKITHAGDNLSGDWTSTVRVLDL